MKNQMEKEMDSTMPFRFDRVYGDMEVQIANQKMEHALELWLDRGSLKCSGTQVKSS